MLFVADSMEYIDKPPAEILTIEKNLIGHRILWIIFDEMDQNLTFDYRPSTLELPEIDRFRNKSLYASCAYPPAGETDLSLPSLITGKLISKYEAISPNDIMLTLSENNQAYEWSSLPNIFSKAHEMGINTALFGWYHPYGRVIGSNLNYFMSNSTELTDLTFYDAMSLQFDLFIKSIPIINNYDFFRQFYVFDNLKRKYFVKSYLEILDGSKEAVVNDDLGLILLHLPVPHPPGIYDRAKKDFSLEEHSYLDNLALADRTLGELRRTMEISGTWDNTTIIVTSDHWLRTNVWNQVKLWTNENDVLSYYEGSDHRVPFMLKLAGQEEGVIYNQDFNTVLTHDLILALLKNELSNPEDVVKWIDNNRLNWSIPDYDSIQSENSS
jgi:hypothetical protein